MTSKTVKTIKKPSEIVKQLRQPGPLWVCSIGADSVMWLRAVKSDAINEFSAVPADVEDYGWELDVHDDGSMFLDRSWG